MNASRSPWGPTYPDERTHPLEAIALGAVGAIVLAGSLLWLTGEVSGFVFGGVWPHVTASETGTVLTHFARHLHDPSLAWPQPARKVIPGPTEFYATMAVIAVPLAGASVFGILRWSKPTTGNQNAARWARRRELRLLRVSRPTAGRLTLGTVGRHLVAAEPRQSVIVVGPVQTGKTSGFAVPAILEWQGPVVATSVKTDLLNDTLAARAAIQGAEVWVYDPTGSTGVPSSGWTPLSGCDTWQGAQRVAAWLASAVQRGNAGIDNPEFWYAAAAKLLSPLLFAAAASQRSMADVVRWVDSQEEEEVRWALESADEPAAITSFDANTFRDERTKSSVYTTTETVLAAYADPGVLASALNSELQAERLLDGKPHTAYLCAPAHEQRRLRPLFATLVQQITARAYEQATDGPLDPPLLLVLDECANIAPLRELATLASTGAGQGIQLVSVFQDMAQISTVYGRDQTPTIVSNHRAKVVLSGIADTQTLEYLGRLLGDEQVPQTSSTQAEGRRSTTESLTYRTLAPANVLREMKPGSGLLVYGHLAPAQLELRPWFKDRRLRKISTGAVP